MIHQLKVLRRSDTVDPHSINDAATATAKPGDEPDSDDEEFDNIIMPSRTAVPVPSDQLPADVDMDDDVNDNSDLIAFSDDDRDGEADAKKKKTAVEKKKRSTRAK